MLQRVIWYAYHSVKITHKWQGMLVKNLLENKYPYFSDFRKEKNVIKYPDNHIGRASNCPLNF